MSALYIIKDALEKAGFATKAEGAEKEEPVAKPAVSGHVAMDAVRRALDAAAPWWQSQGAEPKNGALISPNITTNTLLGAVIGAVLPYAVVLVYSILDTRIKTEDDIKNRFQHPILGQIPRL